MRLRAFILVSIFPLFIPNLTDSFLYKSLPEFHVNGQFKNFSYLSPGGFWGGEEMDGRIRFNFNKGETLGINADLSFQKGFFLCDKWYFDWEETPLAFRIDGSIDNDVFILEEGDIKLAQYIKLNIQGNGDLKKKSFYLNRATLDIENAANAYNLLLKQPLQTLYPVLSEIDLKGKFSVTAKDFCFPDLVGQIWTSFEGDISLPSIQLNELKFILPLFYDSSEEKEFFVRIGRLFFKNEEIENIYLPLLAKANHVHLAEAIRLSVAEGIVSISTLAGTITPFSLRGDIFLENLCPQFLPFLVTLSSDKLSFTLTPGNFKVEGKIACHIWGGEMVVENVEIADIFSPYPKIRADIFFKNIDLDQISPHSPYGEISGVINGYIKNLVIAYGQPESFELVIESVKKKGKKQMISLDAVNNISILAQGAPIMVSWFFPKKYPYRKIGIMCSLKNDCFVIHGLIKKDDVEYLVKRRRFGIDVVNRSPGQAVDFKEMVERFKEISRRE